MKGNMNKLTLKISEIKNNPNNPRLIKDDKFKKLVASIKEFPEMLDAREIVVNKDHIILGGNMRFKAAKEAGLREVPVKIVDWPEDKQRQFVIKDNVSGGEWDWDLIANEWDAQELDAWGLDTPEGWGEEEPEIEEDEAPEVSDEPPVSKLGEIYQLGRHRVMCGSSTDLNSVDQLTDSQLVDMVFTDPPYNVDYGGGVEIGNKQGYKPRKIENDKMSDEDWNQFVRDYMTSILTYCKGNIYIAMSDKELGHMQRTFTELGGRWASFIIWVKNSLVLSAKDYHSRHETILYGWHKDAENRQRVEDRKQDDVWEIDRPSRSEEHPTMKPVELCARAIRNSSKRDASVLDLFLGSGSTLIACEQTDRTCYGMELDPKYVDVIRKRYHKFVTGNEEGWEENTPAIKEQS